MMDDDLTDYVSERQLLAAALGGNCDPLLALPVSAIVHWHHTAIANIIRRTVALERPIHAAAVARDVAAAAGNDTAAHTLAALVVELFTTTVPSDSARYYAERLAALDAVRSVHKAAVGFSQSVTVAATQGDDTRFTTATKAMREALDDAERSFNPAGGVEPPMSLAALLAGEEDPYDWLVPNLLERTDRLILTGFEGTGKSFLLAQFALTVAAGLHPFTGAPTDTGPARVLVFDCENSKRQMRRRYQRISGQVEKLCHNHGIAPPDWDSAVRIISRPEGVALTEARELARIEQNVAATAPDLVLAGPLYKMSKLDVRDEQAAKELTDCLDTLRVRHNFTLIAEAHAGHASDGGGARRIRPIGSSLFLRWPEFGFGIAPHPDHLDEEHPSKVQIKHWRGARDERDWPIALEHGHQLPWWPIMEGAYSNG